MELFKDVVSALTGGLAQQVIEVVQKYSPPDLSPEQKAQIQLDAQQLTFDREKLVNTAAIEAERSLNDRIAMYEGTASDLKSVPIFGPLMLFLRGSQRVIIGYATMYLDYEVFSHGWALGDDQTKSTFWIVNALVLSFLFGERAIKNVAPFIADMLRARSQV